MKPTAVIVEESWQREARHERAERVQHLVASVEREERARWPTAQAMLSWYFAMASHMGSAPGIDYARDMVSGLAVDRDERIAWMGRVRWALEELGRQQGHSWGLTLLWLHHRQARVVGTRVDGEGRRVDVYGEPGLALRELYLHDSHPAGRSATIEAYWEALAQVEDWALARGWVVERVQRERRGQSTQQAWRRHQ